MQPEIITKGVIHALGWETRQHGPSGQLFDLPQLRWAHSHQPSASGSVQMRRASSAIQKRAYRKLVLLKDSRDSLRTDTSFSYTISTFS